MNPVPSRDVLGFGEASIDRVLEVPWAGAGFGRPDWPAKLRISSSSIGCGGQVATAMAACAALGLRAGYLGAVGDDDGGRRILDELQARGVDTSRVIVRPAATRHAVILVEEQTGERLVLWERDPQLDVPVEAIDASLVRGARVVHVDGVDEPAALRVARLAREAGALVTCDLDRVTPATRELLAAATHPVFAANVPQELTGLDDVEEALRVMRRDHAGPLCVTLGVRGAAALDGDLFLQVPAPAVRAVDTTSAGDVFRAGFIYGLLQQWPLRRTLTFANAAAALACTRHGAMASVPNLTDIQRFAG